MNKKRKLMFFSLLVLEALLLLFIAPTTIPQDRKAKALFTEWQKSRSKADEAAFHAEMDRVMAGQRKRQTMAGVLLIINSVILIVVWRRKVGIPEQPQ